MPFDAVIGHDRPKQILKAALRSDQLAHAYLFFGDDSIGKRLTARMFAQAVNCDDPVSNGSDACGRCWACRQTEQNIHPDIFYITPSGDQIKIGQIREMQDYLVYRPLIGRYKIYIVNDADQMNVPAANSLLKTLEEPPDHSLILLISSRPRHLLPTIRSRCQGLRFASLSITDVQEVVERTHKHASETARLIAGFSQGRLGIAINTDPTLIREERDRIVTTIGIDSGMQGGILQIFQASELLSKGESSTTTLTWLTHWIRDLLILQVAHASDRLLNQDRLADLAHASERCSPDTLVDLLERIETVRHGLQRNLNVQLQLEILMFSIYDALGISATL